MKSKLAYKTLTLLVAVLALSSCTQGGSAGKPPVLPDIQITPGVPGNGNTTTPNEPVIDVYPTLPNPGTINPLFALSKTQESGLTADKLVSGTGSQVYVGRLIGKGAEAVSSAAVRFTIQKDSQNTLHFTAFKLESLYVLPFLDAAKNFLSDANNQPTPWTPQIASGFGDTNKIEIDDAQKRVGRLTIKFDNTEKGLLNARVLVSPDFTTIFLVDSTYALIAQKASSSDQIITDTPTSDYVGTFNLSYMDWIPGTDFHVSQGKWQAVQVGGSHTSGFTKWKRSVGTQRENGLGNTFEKASGAIVFRTFVSGSTQSESITHIFALSQDKKYILSIDNTNASGATEAYIGQKIP